MKTRRSTCSRPRGMRKTGWTPTIPACSTMSCASSGKRSRRSWPTAKAPPKKAAAVSRSTYEILPHVVDPAQAIAEGAPVIHPGKTTEHRIANAQRNIAAETHGEFGDVAAALAASAVTYEGTFTTQRVQHAALETHGGIALVDAEGVLNVRSSTQVPFLTRRTLADMFDLPPEKVRVFCERVGGGFGGKQEMFVEDILALAALKTGRPVKLELTREEQFISTSTRHPMRVTHQGRRRQGRQAHRAATRRALQHRRLRQSWRTGAVSRRAASASASITARTRRSMAVVAYTNTLPAGAFRGYGLPQTQFAVESAIDELARQLGISPFEMRRRNVVKPGDPDAVAAGLRISRRGIRLLRARPVPRPGRARDGRGRLEAAIVRRLADRRRHRAHHDRHRAAGRPHRRLLHLLARRRRLRADRRHRRVRQRHRDGASPDRGDRAGDHRRSDFPQTIRHRQWRPRHRRLRLGRHLCRGARHARSRRKISPPRSRPLPRARWARRRPRACSIAITSFAGQQAPAVCEDRRDGTRARAIGCQPMAIRAARRVRSPSTCRAFGSP